MLTVRISIIRLVDFCSFTGLPDESGNRVATFYMFVSDKDMNEYPYSFHHSGYFMEQYSGGSNTEHVWYSDG